MSKILSDLETLTRFRLRMVEIVPVEMSKYRICMCFHFYSLMESIDGSENSRRACLVYSSRPFRDFYLSQRWKSRRRMVFCPSRVSVHGWRGSDGYARSVSNVACCVVSINPTRRVSTKADRRLKGASHHRGGQSLRLLLANS